jgi:phage tail tube protein FII
VPQAVGHDVQEYVALALPMPVEIALGVACVLSDFGYTCAYKTVFLKKRTGGLQKLFPGLSGLFLLFMGH